MILPTKSKEPSKHGWNTLDVLDGDDKFVLEECGKRDAVRHITEKVLCCIVGVLLLGSYLIVILPEVPQIGAYPVVSLSVGMVGIALILYAFATRGYKTQVGFDKVKKQIWICKLNSKGYARIVTHFPKADVKSVFIWRPEAPFKDATLFARIKGKPTPITLLCGEVDDIEAAHRAFCGALRDAAVVRPVRPVLKANSRTHRPARKLRTGVA